MSSVYTSLSRSPASTNWPVSAPSTIRSEVTSCSLSQPQNSNKLNIANKLNISERSLYYAEQSLRKANILTTVNNQLRNKETGCATQTKIFNLKEYCQHMIYAIMQNRARIEENTKEIQYLKDKVEAQGKLIQKLLAERKVENPEFIL